MQYNDLAELVEANKFAVAKAAAETIIAQKIPFYTQFNTQVLAERLLNSVEMMIRYLQTNKVDEWRDYIMGASAKWQNQGSTISEINAAGNIIVEKIHELVERELSDPKQATLKTRFLRRLQGLTTLANVSAFNAHFKKS